jgi:uncharacterized protein (DUF58 family)
MRLWNDQRLRLSLTGLGAQYLLALLAVGAFAANTGNNLLYLVFSLMIGLLLVSGILSRRALQGVTVEGLEDGNIFARVRGGLRLRLGDRHGGRVRGLELHLALADGTVEPTFIGATSREGETLVTLQVHAQRRGTTRLERLELRTRFPFGLMEKSRFIPLKESLLVFPHPRTPPARPASWRGEGHRPQGKDGASSPEGVRPLRIGDPPGRVHWKRTAQRGEPWVRTYEDDRPLGRHLRLDLRAWGPGRTFEHELERLSGAVLQARLQKRDISLELHDRSGIREIRGYRACWCALALAEASGTEAAAQDSPSSLEAPIS